MHHMLGFDILVNRSGYVNEERANANQDITEGPL
jgi:hypothetical protein